MCSFYICCSKGKLTRILCETRQEFRLWLVRDPSSKAACRAMLLGQSSGDQRVKGLAFSRDAVRSGLRSLPGPAIVVKHAVRFARCSSPCGSAAVGDQGGLREQSQTRLGSSIAGGHTGHATHGRRFRRFRRRHIRITQMTPVFCKTSNKV